MRTAQTSDPREALRQEQRLAPLLRELYPQLTELQVEFNFEDGTSLPPSIQRFSYFPAARSLFRYACPCHGCDGQFDLTSHVVTLARPAKQAPQVHRLQLACGGQRLRASAQREPCPIEAQICITAVRATGAKT